MKLQEKKEVQNEKFIADPGTFLVVNVTEDPDPLTTSNDSFLRKECYGTLDEAKGAADKLKRTYSFGLVYDDKGELVYNSRRGFFSVKVN